MNKKFENEELQAIYDDVFADGRVTEEEVLSVFSQRDDFEGEDADEYNDLLLEVVVKYLFDDNEFSEEEGQFLIDLIMDDNTIDSSEYALIEGIIEYCTEHEIEFPENFRNAFDAFFDEEEEEEEEE